MPCIGAENLTPVQQIERKRLQELRLQELERSLLSGRIKLAGDANSPVFEGWDAQERGAWCDACAFRALMAEGSTALRMAAARQQGTQRGRMQAR